MTTVMAMSLIFGLWAGVAHAEEVRRHPNGSAPPQPPGYRARLTSLE